MRLLAAAGGPTPLRKDLHHTGERIERAVLPDERPVRRAPSIALVPQGVTDAPRFRGREHVARVVDAIDVESGFREQMRVAAMSARAIQYPRANRQLEDVDQPRDFAPVARRIEDRFVFQEIAGVKVRGPPVGRRFGQKKTGSRYAPKTSSSAARISYSVQ
jgi:hypothetical protein